MELAIRRIRLVGLIVPEIVEHYYVHSFDLSSFLIYLHVRVDPKCPETMCQILYGEALMCKMLLPLPGFEKEDWNIVKEEERVARASCGRD